MVIFLAKYLIFIVALVAFGAWLQTNAKARLQLGLSILLAVFTAIILTKLASIFYFHHRPFIVNGTIPLVTHGDDNGFPSDHVLVAATLASVVYFYWRKLGMILMVLALLVGLGRVWAGVHWPIDILGGLIIGAFAGWAGYELAKKIFPISQKPTVDQ